MIDKETEEVLLEMANLTKTPLIKMTTERKPILVLDINILSSIYKSFESTEELERFLCEKYDCNVLFVDFSRQNVQRNVTPITPHFI